MHRGVAVSTLNMQEPVSQIIREGGTCEDALATLDNLALEAQRDRNGAPATGAGAMIVHICAHGHGHGGQACLSPARISACRP